MQFLPGCEPDLHGDAPVWGHAVRTGLALSPLYRCEGIEERVSERLHTVVVENLLVYSG